MFISKLEIAHFKQFEQLAINLTPYNCLVGANNSGKTTLLQALALFDFCLHHCLSGKNGTISLNRRSIGQEEFYVLPVTNPLDLWTNRKAQTNRQQQTIKITVSFDEGASVTAEISLSFNRFGISITTEDPSQNWLRKLSQVRIAYLPVFSMFLPQEEMRTSVAIEDELARGRVNSVIRNLLLGLKRENRQHELASIMQRIFPNLTQLDIAFDELNERYISVTYREKNRPKSFDIFSAGSGFQQFIYLFGFILLRSPNVILLDEPDVHLHGSLQRALFQEMQKLVADGKQVLFATHSRELLSRMNPENVLYLDEGVAQRLKIAFDIYETLDKLGSIDPSQLAIVQTFRRVLVIENEIDWEILSIFCAKIVGEQVWREVERRLALCYARGNPWKQDMARLRQQLQQMIMVEGEALQMFIVGDRDYHPNLSDLKQKLPKTNLTWHIWERAEIENYLLSINGCLEIILPQKDRELRLDEIAFQQEFNLLVEGSKDEVYDKLAKAFQEYGRDLDKKWDVATLSKKAREYLQNHWEDEKLFLADAKEIVLPGLKRWLQKNGFTIFSNKRLAELLPAGELPDEIHLLARRLVTFAGVGFEKSVMTVDK